MPRITLYGWLVHAPALFDGIDLPDGVNRTELIDTMIYHYGDLYTYIQVPEQLKYMIHSWFKRRLPDFENVYKALNSDYSPIENYNRYEDYNHKEEETGDTETSSSASTNDSSEAKTSVSAYNETSSYTPRDRTETTADSASNARSGSDYRRKKNNTDTNHIHGNIGVTTTQAMILEELNLRRFNNIYEFIADCFEREFMVTVY